MLPSPAALFPAEAVSYLVCCGFKQQALAKLMS